MHKCTSCCAYTGGCTVDYCVCDGGKNVFEDMWKSCGSDGENKNYRFQVRAPPPNQHEDIEDTFIAIEFQRSKANPHLILHLNQEWAVEFVRKHEGCRQASSNMQLSSEAVS